MEAAFNPEHVESPKDRHRIEDFLATIPRNERKNERHLDLERKYFKSEKIGEVVLTYYEVRGKNFVDIDVYNKEHPDTPARHNSFRLSGGESFTDFLTYTALSGILFADADSYVERKFLSEQLGGYVIEKSGLEKK